MSSYALMTNTGRNKEAAALANGTTLEITEIAWGDGDRFPSGGEATLLNEQGRKLVQGTGLDDGALNTAFFEILLDVNEGPFVVREAGLFDADGDLIAIAKYDPPVNKPKDTVTALIRINVVFSDLENLILKVQSTDAYVPVERKITAGAGLSGGGDLSANRAFAVAFATTAEAGSGTKTDKVMSPKRVAEAIIAQTGIGGDVATVNNLNTLDKTGLYYVTGAAIGSPDPDADGRVIHIQSDREATQIITMRDDYMAFRDKDTAGGAWGNWQLVLTGGSINTKYYSIADAPNSWLIGANFKGDTSVSLDAVSGHCHRIGTLAHIALSLSISGFSIPASDDRTVSTYIDIAAIAQTAGWFRSLASGSIGVAYGRFQGPSWDAPYQTYYCSANSSANTFYIGTNDTTDVPAQTANAEQLELKLIITVLVED